MTTLISMIGTGKFVNQQVKGYEKVTYAFECGKTVTTSCSTNAILSSGIFSIDKVIMIGTTGSYWGELLDDPSPAEEAVFLQLFEDCCLMKRPFDVKSPIAMELKELLKKRWNVQDISFIATTAELTSMSAEDIYRQYIEKCLGASRNVVLDVTHGLRWMPMFITSAIRYKEMVEHGLDNIRILYAEFKEREGGKTGAIRELDALWNGQKIAEAMSLYFEKFDSDELICYLPPSCIHLKEALENFGNSMQADFLMPLVWDRDDKTGGDYPLGKTVKQLRNGISDVDKLEPCPIWLAAVASEMIGWVKRLQSCDYPSERLMILADMFAERRLWGQAIMALDVALRIFACELYKPCHYPDWEDMKANLKILTESLHQYAHGKFPTMNKNMVENINNLMHTRNKIAHGNLNSEFDVSKTQVKPNLSKQYPIYRRALESLFACRQNQ